MIDWIGTLRRLALASVCTAARGAYIDRLYASRGASIYGRTITCVLLVSTLGDGTDGQTWTTAYTTIQDALDNAPVGDDECTLILCTPHATYYDINTTGDPTWAANVIICGTERAWVPIRNDHAAATSVMNFTGFAALENLAVFTTGTRNGVIFTASGWRIKNCGFNSTGLTGAATCVHIDGSGAVTRGGRMTDTQFIGHVTHTTAIHIEQSTVNEFMDVHIHECLRGIHIEDSDSDLNFFHHVGIGDCALGIDIDVGNEQHFLDINFHHNTRNVDDEVQDHQWVNITGAFPIYILPDNFTGIAVACGGAGNVYGGDTQLIAAAAIDNPFRIVGVTFGPDASPAEWYMVRFSADSGVTWYDILMFTGDKREGIAAPSGTEFIFNADTRISCSAKSVSGGNNVDVWVEVQEV